MVTSDKRKLPSLSLCSLSIVISQLLLISIATPLQFDLYEFK